MILSICSAAIGYNDTKTKDFPIRTDPANAPLFNTELQSKRNIPDFTKPTSALQPAVLGLDPSYVGPERICENLNYAQSHTYYWSTPNGYDDTKWGMRFTPSNACTLRSVTVAVAQENGTPGMTVEIYSNAANYPGGLIATFDIPNSALPPLGFYTYLTIPIDAGNSGGATFPDDFIFSAGEEFHVEASVTGGGTVGVETLKFYSDGAEEPSERATVYEAGDWYLMVDSWGFPGNFEIEADVCYEDQGFPDDCYDISYFCGDVYSFGIGPGAGYQQDAYAVQFMPVGGEDSLTSIDIYIWDIYDDAGVSWFDDNSGNFPMMDILLCPATVTGEPDVAGALYTFTVDPIDYLDYPTTFDVAAAIGGDKPAFNSKFFVVFRINGGGTGIQEIDFSTDEADACPSYTTWGLYETGLGAPWLLLYDLYGVDFNLLISVNMCKNLYTTCGWDYAIGGPAYYVSVPGFRDVDEHVYMTAAAIRFDAAAAGCDVDNLDMWFYSGASYAEDAEIGFYDATGPDGLPGNRLNYIPLPNGSASDYHNVAPNFFFESSFWLVVESFAQNDDDIRLITDDGSTPSGRSAFKVSIDGAEAEWYHYTDIFSSERNWYMGIYRCCYPFVVRTCAPDGDWPTMGKDQIRTGSTLNELGDIQCNLTKSWSYYNTTTGSYVAFASPIIADGKVFAYMFNSLVCLDVNTGAELWKRDLNFAEIGGSCRATPTYYNGELFCGGGDNGYFSRFDPADGHTLWTFAMGSHAQYAPHVILDVDGTEVVFVADGAGNLYGLQTSDGSNYYHPGTSTPAWSATGQVHKALTTDGTYLYVGCDQYLTTPNLFCLDVLTTPGTVAEVWNLVDDGPGFQLQNVAAGWTRVETSQEGFYAAITYSEDDDGDWLYFVTTFSPQNQSPVHNGGIMYKLSADGTTLGWAVETNSGSGGALGTISNDKATVLWTGYNGWIGGSGEYSGPNAYSKSNGLPQWGPIGEQPNYTIMNTPMLPDVWAETSQPGLLSCETIADPGQHDWYIFGEWDGFWCFANTAVGEIEWTRRTIYINAHLGAPIADEAGHVIITSGRKVHGLANGAPRPRLQLVEIAPELPVPFGLPSYYEVAFPDVIQNVGCADLEIFHVELLDDNNGTFPNRLSPVNTDRAEHIQSLAMKSTGRMEKALNEFEGDNLHPLEPTKTMRISASAAYALPAYILSVLEPADGTILGPGEFSDIRLAIDGSLVPRGASQFYAEIDSDDPDYFLDSAYMDLGGGVTDYAKPAALMTVIGGCLPNFTTLYFGDGGGNHISVWNSTLIYSSNGVDGDDGLEIDGNTSYLYGCDGTLYCNGPERVVLNSYDGSGNKIYESTLPDPLPTCDFAEANDVILAEMSDDGSAYSNVLGTILNYAFVDTMEDYRVYTVDTTVTPWDTTISWEWDVEIQTGINTPYSNELTEGWAFKTLVSEYSVTDVTGPKYAFEDFWNFTIKRHSVYSRYGYAIPHLYVGMIADWDVDNYANNTTGYSEDYSVGWIYDPTSIGPTLVTGEPDYGGGIVKVPFGPGYTPLINSVDATTSWWSSPEPNWDSIYVWMSRPSTQFSNYKPYALGTDRRMWNTIADLNLPAWAFSGDESDPVPPEAFETFGFAFFGKFTDHNAAALDNYSGMATLINKFCGFGRGDVNDDGVTNLVDIVYLNNFVYGGGNGPFPFKHLGDIDGVAGVDGGDITYLINWYFGGGPNPIEDWSLPQFAF
jgi:hypothetical protein